MPGLSARDHQRLLGLVIDAMRDVGAGRTIWPTVLGELAGSLGVTLGGAMDVQWPAGTVATLAVWPGWPGGTLPTPAENRAYPLIRHYGNHADTVPHTLREVADRYRWLTSPRYAPMRAWFGGAREQIMVPLGRSGGAVRLLGAARPDVPFTDRERAFLNLLQPALIELDRHTETIERWRRTATAGGGGSMSDCLAGHHITPRELAVLALLAEGQSVVAVGHRLGISPRTVTKHQENLQRKLRTVDRLSTVLRAQQLGIVAPRAASRIEGLYTLEPQAGTLGPPRVGLGEPQRAPPRAW
ncbi:response regulator transcription factor [Dactylosporangium sp. CA-139066]|uniref:helix-turn-helix transcriptional regulator n=1 Tax=Dactylosporangium sp. CA-139066 TaxID=3239930 RepID=UPI003D9152BE